ncbi:unnamed protein product [Cyclocybe aegerita]|uniref:Uncharacterized protein n=1 Tax=Cyclocybe aegerita TaxID=1973307 RepID=A0A8S0WLQ0_CYCAE|nr:unnamed protein product [Cyclocybe aegerita]
MAQTMTTTFVHPTSYFNDPVTHDFDHDLLNVPEAQAARLFMNYETIDDKLGLNGRYPTPEPLDTIKLAKEVDPRTSQRRAPTHGIRMEDLDKGTGRMIGRAASPHKPGEGPRLYSNIAARELALERDRLRVLAAQRLAGTLANGMCCPHPDATHCSETNEPHWRYQYDGPAVAWHYQAPQYPSTYSQALLQNAPVREPTSLSQPEAVDPWDLSSHQAPVFYRKMFVDADMPPSGGKHMLSAAESRASIPHEHARPSTPPKSAVVDAKKMAAKKNNIAKKVQLLRRRGSQVY